MTLRHPGGPQQQQQDEEEGDEDEDEVGPSASECANACGRPGGAPRAHGVEGTLYRDQVRKGDAPRSVVCADK